MAPRGCLRKAEGQSEDSIRSNGSTHPRAMAPPLGFTVADSRPRVLMTMSDCEAKASLSSQMSTSSLEMPKRL